MTKFRHDFSLEKQDGATFLYTSEDNHVRLDFMEGMLRVAIYRDGERIFPTFSVCPDDRMPYAGRDKLSVEGFRMSVPSYEEADGIATFRTGDLRISVGLRNFEIRYHQGGRLLFADRAYSAYNFGHEYGRGSCHYLTREEDEEIYGLGDKTGDVNKNKRSFRLGTSDAMGFDARSSDPLYKHIPFYMCKNSVGSYGIFYDTYADGAFDFGREINNYYAPFKSFRCEEETLVYYVFFGSLEEILISYASLRGRDFLPPKWTLQYCGSTMAYTDAPDASRQLEGFVEKCREYGFRPGGFYMSSGYTQIGEKRYVFHWNTDKIPSPEGLSTFFRENGIEFLPNIKPCFLTDHPLYDRIARHGWFLKGADGEPAVFPFWDGYGSYLDFTNPEAATFWTDCVRRELAYKGYRNTWNDNNEYDIQDEEVYADGFGTPIRAKLIKPLFAYLMTRASLAATGEEQGAGEEAGAGQRPNAVSRCGMPGTSRIASTWTGDNRTSFEDFEYNHRMAMTMSLSGIYNFGQDIGGFAGPRPSKELFLRWIQYGIFTPRFVLHSWNTDKSSNMPWLYEDEIPQVKRLFALREHLIPYLYNQIWRSAEDHRPVIYPLFLRYPEYSSEYGTFFFGDDMLVSPVFREGSESVDLTLPENNGNWYREDPAAVGGSAEAGSCMACGDQHLTCGIHDLPVYFIKGGCVIRDENGYRIYPMESGTFTESYLEDDGVSPLTADNHRIVRFTVTADRQTVCVETDAEDVSRIRVIDGFGRKVLGGVSC